VQGLFSSLVVLVLQAFMRDFAPGTPLHLDHPASGAQHDNLAMGLTGRIPKLVTIAKHNLVSD
jgi:hypothetical protein